MKRRQKRKKKAIKSKLRVSYQMFIAKCDIKILQVSFQNVFLKKSLLPSYVENYTQSISHVADTRLSLGVTDIKGKDKPRDRP